MKLRSIRLVNFRGITDQLVHFGEGITIIEGPNEAGKSSIADALRLIRKEKASSRKQYIGDIQPVGRDVGPEVVVELTTGGYELTYRKRWLKKPETELRVTGTRSLTLTGDEAHDRFQTILAETLDLDLLAALETLQGSSLEQPGLGGVQALAAALDSSGDSPAATDSLLERIEQEYGAYHTATGRPTGAYRELLERQGAQAPMVQKLEAESRELDDFVQEHAVVSTRRVGLDASLLEARVKLRDLAAEDRRLEDLRRAASEALQAEDQTGLDAERAEAAVEHRALLVEELAERSRTLEAVGGRLQELRAGADAARQESERAGESARLAEQAHDEAVEAVQTIRDRAAVARGRKRLSDLRSRIQLASRHREREIAAAARAAERPAEQATLERLHDLDTEVKLRRATLEAASARVVVTSIWDRALLLDGAVVAPGDVQETTAVRAVRIEVPDVAVIEIHPAAESSAPEQQFSDAERDLRAALGEAGFESLAEADEAAAAAREAEQERRSARSALDAVLGDDNLADLEDEAATLTLRLGREGEEAGGMDAEAALPGAESRELESRAAAADARRVREERERVAAKSRESAIRAEQEHKHAADEADRAERSLARARQDSSDAELERQSLLAAARAAEAKTLTQAATTLLDAADPEGTALRLDNARGLVERRETELREASDRLTELNALIEDRIGRGIYDRLALARAELGETNSDLAQIGRRAKAAALLRSTMLARKTEAEQAYVAPFRERVERLGRLLFGSDRGFAVEVSQELAVTSRTLDGKSVPFGSLSAGTREQIALLGRLACAQLVNPDDGAPVILDDTLGFADPRRLAALGAVLNHVGQGAQIIILTCQPGRFATIGNASVERLGSW